MALTQADLGKIKRVIGQVLDKALCNLPTREEFIAKMDEVMKELETIRQEQKLISYRVSKEDQITALKAIHPHGQHAPA